MSRLANSSADHDTEGLREGREARLEGRQSAHVLEVEGNQVERAEKGCGEQEHHNARRAEEPTSEQSQVHQRTRCSQLDDDEREQEEAPGQARGDHLRGGPRVQRAGGQAVHEQSESDPAESESRHVERAGIGRL